MTWRVVVRPEAEDDVVEAAAWYERRSEGLGVRFLGRSYCSIDALAETPLLHCRRHPTKNIRWRYPEHFPYRVIYEVIEEEKTVVVGAVLHAARHDRQWRRRF